jgi:Domain of unknown function (DUF4259)
MGAWGHGIFENDTACDFGAAVSDGGGISLVEQALDRVLASGENYLEVSDAEEGLAAVEIVARLKGSPGDETAYTESIDTWIKDVRPSASAALVEKAKRAIARVLSEPSELVEVWMESDEFDAWKQAVEALRARL